MANRSELFRKLHDEGMSYEQIGRVYGISRQAVHQALTPRDGFREAAVKKIKWVGLREWMLSNRVSFTQLGELAGVTNFRATIYRDCDPRKSTIDGILAATGLTYEECFREEKVTNNI